LCAPFSPVPCLTPSRLIAVLLFTAAIFTAAPMLRAQDQDEPSLGDLARSLRKKPIVPESVIDNDNLPKVMDDAETRRMNGEATVFSLAPAKKTFQISSPDVTCSLSYTAKSANADALLLDDLPREEMDKLQGPATIDGDTLQISVHNGSSWEVHEVVIGLTILRSPAPSSSASKFGNAKIIPAVASETQQPQDSLQKQPDVTLLLHVKGLAAPSATAVFRTALNFALFPDQDWHWAIIRAKGIAPQTTVGPAISAFDQPSVDSQPALPQFDPLVSTKTSSPPLAPPVTPPVSNPPEIH
jgi:hypothetical protein